MGKFELGLGSYNAPTEIFMLGRAIFWIDCIQSKDVTDREYAIIQKNLNSLKRIRKGIADKSGKNVSKLTKLSGRKGSYEFKF